MPRSSQESIQAAFDQLGLGTEEERLHFRNLAEPMNFTDAPGFSIRLDTESISPPSEGMHAKLAPAAPRDKN